MNKKSLLAVSLIALISACQSNPSQVEQKKAEEPKSQSCPRQGGGCCEVEKKAPTSPVSEQKSVSVEQKAPAVEQKVAPAPHTETVKVEHKAS